MNSLDIKGLLPYEAETRMRMLKWYQSMAASPANNTQVLCAIFRISKREQQTDPERFRYLNEDFSIAACGSPWAHQFFWDLGFLGCVEEGRDLLEEPKRRSALVFCKRKARNDFMGIDVQKLRSNELTNCIPPPGLMPENVEKQTANMFDSGLG